MQVRIGLHAAHELAAQLDGAAAAMDTDDAPGGAPSPGSDAAAAAGVDARLPLYDRMINAYNEVHAAIRAMLQVSAPG